MKKQISFILCGLSFSMGAMAAVLTPEQALQRLNTPGIQKIGSINGNARELVYTAKTLKGDPAVYVFEKSGRGGYLLLSADDAVAPLLGYSDRGTFDAAEMPEQMKWWLEEYGRQIEYARENNLPAYAPRTRAEERKAVTPLLDTKWNQTAPYNDLTPVINDVHCPTGCVATAVAQVMKFWNYPERATGTGTITNPATAGKETMALGEEAFEWNKMLNSYSGNYTSEQAHAVAYLMKAVGYACEMNYGQSSSGAFSYIAALALMNNFDYNPQIEYCTRNYFTGSEWEEIIYNEVANGRPVIYGGQSTSVGHEFVCDGYSSDGYFHFNWGWSGMSDGYFILDSLNPNAIGTGGGQGGGYNYAQDALIGVQPKDEKVMAPNLVQYGNLKATASGLNLDLSLVDSAGGNTNWYNTGLRSVTLSLGLAVESLDNDSEVTYITILSGTTVAAPDYEIKPGSGLTMRFAGIQGNVSAKLPFTLDDGRYKLTIVTKPENSATWTPVQTMQEYYNYVIVSKSDSKLTVETLPAATLTLDSAELASALYYGCVVKMKIKVTNNSDKELTQGFYPELFSNNEEQMIGDGVVLTVPAKATVTEEFITTFRLLSGGVAPTNQQQYQLAWYDPINNTMYDDVQDVMMKIITNEPNVTISDFSIVGVTPSVADVAGVGSVNLYTVAGTDEVEFSMEITSNRGFFGYPLYVVIFEASGSSKDLASALFDPLVTLEKGESAETTARLNLSSLQKDHPYAALMYYESNNRMEWLEACPPMYFQLTENSGVDGINADENLPVKYYNLQGVEITAPSKGMLLIKKQGSKTVKVIY